MPAENIEVVSKTDTSITITWSRGRDETAWELSYKLNEDIVYEKITITEAQLPYTITGLSAHTLYNIVVRSVCGADLSEGVVLNVKTYDPAHPVWDGGVDVSWYTNNPSANTFYIYTAEQFAGFAAIVNGEGKGEPYKTNFANKNILLMNDIYLNEDNFKEDIENARNFTPIGGNPFEVNTDEDDNNRYFSGHFDGQYHVIYNLCIINENGSQGGLFGSIGGNTVIENTIIKNMYLKVAYWKGAFVGTTYRDAYVPRYLTRCMVIDMTVPDGLPNDQHPWNYKQLGGLFGSCERPNTTGGHGSEFVYAEGCAVLSPHFKGADWQGCFAGGAEHLKVTNSYFVGGADEWRIGDGDGGSSNVYVGSLEGSPDFPAYGDAGKNGVTNGVQFYTWQNTLSTMKSANFVSQLNNGGKTWEADFNFNHGYPILSGYQCSMHPTGDTVICAGNSATLSATQADSFTWSSSAWGWTTKTGSTVSTGPLTQNTTFYVSGTVGSRTVTESIIVYVTSGQYFTTSVYPAGKATATFDNGQKNIEQLCGDLTPVNLHVVASNGWYIKEIRDNNAVIATYTSAQNKKDLTQTMPSNVDSKREIQAVLSNQYELTLQNSLYDDISGENRLTNESLGVFNLWGNNGKVALAGSDSFTIYFQSLSLFPIKDIVIDSVSRGAHLASYTFENINENHSVHIICYNGCVIHALPVEQTFASVSSGLPACWSTSENPVCEVITQQQYMTPHSLALPVSSGATFFEFPLMDPKLLEKTPLSTMYLTFGLKAGNLNAKVEIGVLDAPGDYSTFVPVQYIIPASTDWTSHVIRLTSYSGNGRIVALRANKLTAVTLIDDIYLTACTPPDSLFVQNTISRSVVSWANNPDVSEWGVSYKRPSDSLWSAEIKVSEPEVVLASLLACETYTVRVRALCWQSDTSYYRTLTFTTRCSHTVTAEVNNPAWGDITPSGNIQVEDGANLLVAFLPAEHYEVSEVKINQNTVLGGDTARYATTYLIPNIHQNLNLVVYFSARTGINSWALPHNNMRVYPNPARDELKIDLPDGSQESGNWKIENVQILDLTGRIIANGQRSTVNVIDISHLPAGMYLLRVTMDKNVETVKFVKDF
ncbi:MAG: T9SS type A sorting domain-containing protein [Bacteroidales bacterium]|nr:T9SS type A sorting domain-containing protein [Bacteroidales bacterium]